MGATQEITVYSVQQQGYITTPKVAKSDEEGRRN